MTLLRKYYEADLSTGGGIPDEDVIRKHVKAYYYHKDRQLNDDDILPLKRVRAIVNEIKQTHSEELARLKEENERLRGEDDPFSLHDVLKRLSGATKYLLDKKDYDGPDYEELEICVLRAKEIIRELETTPSPTKK